MSFSVERRREPRIAIDEYVRVTHLSDPPGNATIGCAIEQSGRGLSLVIGQCLPVGASVRIDQGDWVFLGEVVHCRGDEAAFRIGVEVEHAFCQTEDLEALRRAMDYGVRTQVAESTVVNDAGETIEELARLTALAKLR